MDSAKKQQLIYQIKLRYQQKYGISPEVQNILNKELDHISTKPKISKQDLYHIDSQLRNIANPDIKTPPKLTSSINNQPKAFSKSFKPYRPDHSSKRGVVVGGGEEDIRSIDSESTIFSKSYYFKAPIVIGKVMNSDLNGFASYLRKDIMSCTLLTPFKKNVGDSTDQTVNVSNIMNKSSAFGDLSYKQLRPKISSESKIRSMTPLLKRAIQQHKQERSQNRMKTNFWGPSRDSIQHDRLSEGIISNREAGGVVNDAKLKQRPIQSRLFTDSITHLRYPSDERPLTSMQYDRDVDEAIINEDSESRKEELEKIQSEMMKLKEKEKKILEEAKKTNHEDKEFKKMRMKKVESEKRLEDGQDDDDKLKQKALLRESQQKAIRDHMDAQYELNNQEKAEEKRIVENQMKKQEEAELKVKRFYESIRAKDKERFERNLKYYSISPKRSRLKTSTSSREEDLNGNTSLFMPYNPIDYEKKFKKEREIKTALIKQQEEKKLKIQEEKNQLDEQNYLWRVEEDRMQGREIYLKELEKAKRQYMKQELDFQIMQNNFLKDDDMMMVMENTKTKAMTTFNTNIPKKIKTFY